MPTKTHVERFKENEKVLSKNLQSKYQSGTGTLLYLIKHSRPDLSNAVRELTKAMDIATVKNYEQLIRVIKFVLENENRGVELSPIRSNVWKMRCYTDSDWAGDINDRRSISGWCIFVDKNLLCWGSKSQKNVTTSSTEAEYLGISEVSKELMFMIHILQFMNVKVDLPVQILVDNVGAIYIANNSVTKRTKHIDTRYHMIREHVEDGIVKIIYVKTTENLADIFTKNVSQEVFVNVSDQLRVKLRS